MKTPPARPFHRYLATTALTGSLLLALSADAAQVRLTTEAGTAAIEGDLVSYENGVYTVDTVIGQISVADDGVICEGAGCDQNAATTEVSATEEGDAPNGIPGESITLSSEDSAVRIEGTLVAFANGTYTISTVIGTFDVESQGNVCEGPGCPTGASVQAAVSNRLPTIGAGEDEPVVVEEKPEENVEVAAVEPEPAPEPVVLLPQVLLADVGPETPSVTIAGPASVLDGLLPALADIYAQGIGGTAQPADITAVEPEIAVAAGYPSGRLAAIVEGADPSGLAVVGQLTQTSGAAISSLNDATADIALSASQAPMMLVRNRTEAVLGNEALVATVSPANGIVQLTPVQLANVLSGRVTNWQDVGGDDRTIDVYALPDSHDLSAARDAMVLAPFNLTARTPDQLFATEADLAAALADNAAAIGLVSHSAAGDAKTLAVGSTCGISTAATPENIRTARYPYSRSLVALSFAADGAAADIIDALERADDEVIEAAGLEPITLARFSMSGDEETLRTNLPGIEDRFQRLNAANALRVMPTSERLSTMLTYDGRSNRLDTRSKAELSRILAFVGAAGLTELVVAGHVDGSGDARADKTTARGLAAGVRRALETADTDGMLDKVVVRAVGVGSVLPLECSVAGAEDTLNRRVEIWVRR